MKKLLLLLSIFAVNAINAQWTTQATGFAAASRGLDNIEVVDANTVWATAYDGSGAAATIYDFTRTTNGGTTWTPGTIDVTAGLSVSNLAPVSATTAWAGAYDSTNGLGGVWKTADGGVTWNQQNASAYTTSGTLSSWFNIVHFWDANTGITMGDPIGSGLGEFEIYRTTDGGTTWTAIPAASIPNPASGEYGYNGGMVVAGNVLWFTTNKGKLYRTIDMGLTWTKLNGPAAITDFGSAAINGRVHFSDQNNGFVLGTTDSNATYKIYTTSNGGLTWNTGVAYTSYDRIMSYIAGTSTIVATSANTTAPAVPGSSYSNDRGVTWTLIDTGTQRGTVAFLNPSTGWCAGFNTNATTGGVFKYTGPALATADFNTNTADFTVYPNPSNGVFKIASPTVNVNQVTVFDMLGKIVHSQSFDATSEVTVDISNLQSGAYFMKAVSVEGAIQTIRVMKN